MLVPYRKVVRADSVEMGCDLKEAEVTFGCLAAKALGRYLGQLRPGLVKL